MRFAIPWQSNTKLSSIHNWEKKKIQFKKYYLLHLHKPTFTKYKKLNIFLTVCTNLKQQLKWNWGIILLWLWKYRVIWKDSHGKWRFDGLASSPSIFRDNIASPSDEIGACKNRTFLVSPPIKDNHGSLNGQATVGAWFIT